MTDQQAGHRTLGAVIEERRRNLKLSKSEAARLAGVGRGTWHEVEGNIRLNVTSETLDRMDEALGWDPGTLASLARPLELKTQVYSEQRLAEMRMQFFAYAVSLRGDQLADVLAFITDALSDNATLRRNDLEEIKVQIKSEIIADLRQLVGAATL
jgi:hypothetical protein